MRAPQRVLIAGCGYVGTELGLRLREAGAEVWGLRRDPSALPREIHGLAADLTVPADLESLPSGLDAVVYAASAGGATPERYQAAYEEGPRHLRQALQRAGQRLQSWIYVSSTRVYEIEDGAWVDEETTIAPRHFAGQALQAGESLSLDGPWPATVVRFGGIYGPGRTSLVERVRDGEAKRWSGPPSFTNRIHRDDCAGFLAHLLALEERHLVYLGIDDEPAERSQVLEWMAQELGVAPPPVAPPPEPGPRGRTNKRCRNRRLRASGYGLLYPTFREGYRQAVQEARSRG